MYKYGIFFLALLALASCKEPAKNSFSVSGTIENNTAKVIYLEEVPAVGSSSQPLVADSAELGKDGKFVLYADPKEPVMFNLRLDQSVYPIASVINDAPSIELDIHLKKENNQFTEKYEVRNSPASQQLKDFVYEFTDRLANIFYNIRETDSLQQTGNDSAVLSLKLKKQELLADIKDYSTQAFAKATNPSLVIFELGYYQSADDAQRYGIQTFDDEEVLEIIAAAAKRFPAHQGLTAIHNSLSERQKKMKGESWVGREAPDFSMPDVDGKTVKLSSFRGKYVLVDFWASWCGPCRAENPNVVSAYNQFKDKNFTVLGVSLDREGQKNNWLKAIQQDRLTWTQVSDLQDWNTSVVNLYGFSGIPYNVLINPEGKVIAEKLRGKKLEEKLAEVLQ